MPAPDRSHLSDLRGALRLAVDATQGITDIVEKMHRTIQLTPGPLGAAPADRPRGITGLVYRTIQTSARLIGKGLDAGLAPIGAWLPDGDSTPTRDAYRSVVNGIYGDHLASTDNPLAIAMSLRHAGRHIDVHDPNNALATSGNGKLLLLVHGLCMNDLQWRRENHDHGAALADEFGYVPVYLRYNSGLGIADNGAALAQLLQTLVDNRATPLQELTIIGHSMGGLVARSARHHADRVGHTWQKHLRKLVFLGTPHLGAPLERGGHGIDTALGWSPYSLPLSRLGTSRSAGITDLRHGTVCRVTQTVPLPAGVECYAIAAALADRRSLISERLTGDGLVPLDSALGRHRDVSKRLDFARDRQWIGYRMGHLELLNRAEVYAQIRRWMAAGT